MMFTFIDNKFASVKKTIMVHKMKIKWIFFKVMSVTGYVGH